VGKTLKEIRDGAQREAISEALSRLGGSVSAAARELGVQRSALYRLMSRLGVRKELSSWAARRAYLRAKKFHGEAGGSE
jgi:DNA-binding NtrC family response regulator